MVCACSKDACLNPDNHIPGIIPIKDALHSLDLFLSEKNLPQTKSGEIRSYNSVSTYYGEGLTTRADNETSSGELPMAYIVNFENNEGFAVLGANEAMPDILAVTENGHINPSTLQVGGNENANNNVDRRMLFNDMDNSEIEEFNQSVVITTDSLYYSAEDEDYYSGTSGVDHLATALIRQGIGSSYNQYFLEDFTENPDLDNESGRYASRSPMLSYSWSQGHPYNSYCKRGASKQKEAYTGCSTTAMAMIVAYNEFPQTLIINDTRIDYSGIKSGETAFVLNDTHQNQIALLMGGIYSKVKKVTTSGFTLITPKQIQKCLKEFKYSNVSRICGSSLTSSMLSGISKMLSYSKPVFISAIPKGIDNWKFGHSWVIDGAKYSSQNTYLLHMNLGWSASSNGYYSINCLNPARGEEYDDPGKVETDDDYYYSWHFRIITYDIPSNPSELSFNL